jgi:hypothetical protein
VSLKTTTKEGENKMFGKMLISKDEYDGMVEKIHRLETRNYKLEEDKMTAENSNAELRAEISDLRMKIRKVISLKGEQQYGSTDNLLNKIRAIFNKKKEE